MNLHMKCWLRWKDWKECDLTAATVLNYRCRLEIAISKSLRLFVSNCSDTFCGMLTLTRSLSIFREQAAIVGDLDMKIMLRPIIVD